MSGRMIPLILCGGAGARLWPASRDTFPRQFLPLFDARSIFQDIVIRVSDDEMFERPIVVTGVADRFMVLEQLAEVGIEADVLLEPVWRGSGPAIAAGASYALARDADAVVLALATDHIVRDSGAFLAACRQGFSAAESGWCVTIGIRPDRCETERSYISPGQEIAEGVRRVAKFVKKRDGTTTNEYNGTDQLWNSGNFIFRASVLLDEYRKFDVASVEAVIKSVGRARCDLGFVTLDADSFGVAATNSIDSAVMDNTAHAAVVTLASGWSEVGCWHAVWELLQKDAQGNAVQGAVVLEDSKNCLVSSDRLLVALEGVEDLIVVVTQDAVLVSHQHEANGLNGELFAKLKKVAPQVVVDHLKVRRPWGSYQSVDNGNRHQVKRILVKPGQRLSLQKHYHRSEHWIVVRGTARVTVNDLIKTVHENESIYVPMGAVHRLENPGKILLELIEVQTGSYLGEDDIVRIEDDYRRH